MRGRLGLLLTVALLGAVLAACGDDSNGDPADEADAADEEGTDDTADDDGTAEQDDGTGDDTEADSDDSVSDEALGTPPDDFDGQVIEVTLTDHEIEMDTDAVDGGEVFFRIVNDGDTQHGLATAFPDQEHALTERVLEPGEVDEIHTSFDPDMTFLIYCPVGDHRDAHGMEIEITTEP